MSTRVILAGLFFALLASLAATWLFFLRKPAPRAQLDNACSPAQLPETKLAPKTVLPPTAKSPGKAEPVRVEPPAPAVQLGETLEIKLPVGGNENAPSQGTVLFQLIDEQTGAICNAPYELFQIHSGVAELAAVPSVEEAREHAALACFSILDQQKPHGKTGADGRVRVPFRYTFLPMDGGPIGEDVFPVAEGFQPVTKPGDVLMSIISRYWKPDLTPIEIRLRKMQKLSGRVLDYVGKPVPGATVVAYAQYLGPDNSPQDLVHSHGLFELAAQGFWWDQQTTDEMLAALQRYLESRHEQVAGEGATTVTCEEEEFDRRFFVAGSWPTPRYAKHADAEGRYDFQVPSGDYLVVAYASPGIVGHASAVVSETPLPTDLRLGVPLGGAALRVTLNWPDGEVPADLVYSLSLERRSDYKGTGVDDSYQFGYWSVAAHRQTNSVVAFDGLSEGDFDVIATANYSTDQGSFSDEPAFASEPFVKLTLSRTAEVTLVFGDAQRASLFIQTRFNGKLLPASYVQLRRVEQVEWQEFWFGFTEDAEGTRSPDWQTLRAGEYEIAAVSAPPRRITLARGEKHEEVLDWPACTLDVSLTDELRHILSRNAEEPEKIEVYFYFYAATNSVELALFGLSQQTGLAEATSSIEWPGGQDPLILSGDAVRLVVPQGVYRWGLSGLDNCQGLVDLRGKSQLTLRLGLDALPGLARADLKLEGVGDRECNISVCPAPESNQTFGSGSWPRHLQNGVAGEAQAALLPGANANTYIILAPPGRYQAQISCAGRATEGEEDSGQEYVETNFVFDVPGKYVVDLGAMTQTRTLRVVYPPTGQDAIEMSYRTKLGREGAVESSGWSGGEDDRTPLTQECQIPREEVELLIIRRRYETHPGADGESEETIEITEYATRTISSYTTDPLIDVREVVFQLVADIEVTVRGRCPGELMYDPWWNEGTPAVYLVALDSKVVTAGMMYAMNLEQQETGSPPSRHTYPVHIMPGRYKVIPWLGAPDSACKIVDIRPGATEKVIFEGK